MTRPHAWLAVLSFAAFACGDGAPPAPPPAVVEALAEGVVAEVGQEAVSAVTVKRIAASRGLDREAALEAAIRDAVFAAGARADLDPSLVASAERRVLAYALMREAWLETKQLPVTEAELAEATEVRWTRYDRPTGYRTVHVVVQLDEGASEEDERRAKEHAEQLRQALQPVAQQARRQPAPELDEEAMFRGAVKHPDEIVAVWEEAVKAIDHGDLKVLAQPLPPITAEGRAISHDNPLDPNTFDEEFTRQVAALTERGELTEVFRSYAGYHVAMLLEITPARRLDPRARLEALRDEILRVRGLRQRRARVGELRKRTSVEQPLNVDALLSQVRIELDEG